MKFQSAGSRLRVALLAGGVALAAGVAAAQPIGQGGGNGRQLPDSQLIAAPPVPPPEPGTSQSPPNSPRVTDRSSMNGTWDMHNDRNNPRIPASPAIPDPPLKPEIRAQVAEKNRLSREAADRGEPIAYGAVECLPEGFPAMLRAGFPMEILVTPGQVTMINEAFNQVRRIYLDEKQGTPGDVEPVFFGHSVGKWEGDTLVVDTIGVKENVEFRNIPHSDQMRITERIRMLDQDHIRNDTTIVDPQYLTAPWTFSWIYKRVPGYKIQEYVCEDKRVYRDEKGVTRLQVEK